MLPLLSVLLPGTLSAQSVGVGTNLFYLGTTTPNVHLDVRLANHWSLSLASGWNPWQFPAYPHAQTGEEVYPKLMHWSASPEVKYWFCKAFRESYLGLHGIALGYNVGGISFIPFLRNHRYQGVGYGAGLTYGYQWAIGGRWGLELSLGAGYVWLKYKKYDCWHCGDELGTFEQHYVGPTKAALSFVYYFN